MHNSVTISEYLANELFSSLKFGPVTDSVIDGQTDINVPVCTESDAKDHHALVLLKQISN